MGGNENDVLGNLNISKKKDSSDQNGETTQRE